MKRENSADILFWQENARPDIPGNMNIIFANQSNVSKIFVQQKNSFEKLINLGAPADKLELKGYIYSYKKSSKFSKNILICTNSDQIIRIKELITAFPDYCFHIVALTEMSSRLLSLGDFKNVLLYPSSTIIKIKELFQKCDIYLDVNRGNEILESVEREYLCTTI